jgi:hypothetical protein
LKNWRIEESELTDESGELLSDTVFLISAQMNPGACTLAAFGDDQTAFNIPTSNLLTVAVYSIIIKSAFYTKIRK